mgnify:CR=1 FL=1
MFFHDFTPPQLARFCPESAFRGFGGALSGRFWANPPHLAHFCLFWGFVRAFQADFPPPHPLLSLVLLGRGGSPAKQADFFAGKGPPFAAFIFVASVGFAPTPKPRKPAKGGLKNPPAGPKMGWFLLFQPFWALGFSGFLGPMLIFGIAGQAHFRFGSPKGMNLLANARFLVSSSPPHGIFRLRRPPDRHINAITRKCSHRPP